MKQIELINISFGAQVDFDAITNRVNTITEKATNLEVTYIDGRFMRPISRIKMPTSYISTYQEPLNAGIRLINEVFKVREKEANIEEGDNAIELLEYENGEGHIYTKLANKINEVINFLNLDIIAGKGATYD